MDRGTEFHLDMGDEGEDELTIGTPRFRRSSGYEEEHEDEIKSVRFQPLRKSFRQRARDGALRRTPAR